MRYKNDNDNRYRVNFMRATEELMDKLTVAEFITYLEENAEFEDNDTMYLDGKIVDTKVYCLQETDTLRKEFIVTEDGRVFYWLSLIQKIELIDIEEVKEEVKEMTYKVTVTIGCTGGGFRYETNSLKEVEKTIAEYSKDPINEIWVWDEKIQDHIYWKRTLCYEPEINLLGSIRRDFRYKERHY